MLDRRTLAAKDLIAPRYADLVYEGRWWTTEREAYDAFVERHAGARHRLGHAAALQGLRPVVGRESEHALYDERFVTFGEDDVYQQSDAAGFIRLFALPAARARAQGSGAGCATPQRRRRGRRVAGSDARSRSRDDDRDDRRVTARRRRSRRTSSGAGASPAARAPALDALNNSIGIDFRLWPFDIRLSKAWAVALWGAGVLTLEESSAIERGLDAVAARLRAGEQPIASDEDVHTLIDRLLHEEVGDVASKLHTGRSRNDQVATATRLWAMDACAAARRRRARAAARDARAAHESLRDGAHAVVHAHAARHPVSGRALDAVALLAARARSRAPRAPRRARRRAPARLRRRRRLRVSRSRACCSRAASASTPLSPN